MYIEEGEEDHDQDQDQDNLGHDSNTLRNSFTKEFSNQLYTMLEDILVVGLVREEVVVCHALSSISPRRTLCRLITDFKDYLLVAEVDLIDQDILAHAVIEAVEEVPSKMMF